MVFDWHSAVISRMTPVDSHYKNTQNVRRFMREQCGADFTFDRDFMAWIIAGTSPRLTRNMGDVVDEWQRRNARR